MSYTLKREKKLFGSQKVRLARQAEGIATCKTLLDLIMAGRAWEQAGPSLKADLTKDTVSEMIQMRSPAVKS